MGGLRRDGGRPRRRTVRRPVCAGLGSRRRSGRAPGPDAGLLGQPLPGVCGEHGRARPADDRPAQRPQHAAERPDPDARLVAVRDRLALRHHHPGRRAQHPDDRRRLPRLGLRGQPGRRGRTRCRQPRPAAARDRHPAAAAGGPDAQRGDAPTSSAPSRPAGSPAARPRAWSCGRATRSAAWAGSTCGPTRRPGSPSSSRCSVGPATCPAMSSTFLDFSDAAPATGGPGVHRAARCPRTVRGPLRRRPGHRPVRWTAPAGHPARLHPVPARRPGADDRRVRRGRHPARGECGLGPAGRLPARRRCDSRRAPASCRRASSCPSARWGCC